MDFQSCILYGIKDVKTLQHVLGCKLFEYHDNNKIYKDFYSVRVLGEKQRLVEVPCKKLKKIQKSITRHLSKLDFPDYVMSVKGHCFMDSVIAHANAGDFIIKIDISKFYPNTARDKVYKFWREAMCMSPSIAELITNLTTVTTSEATAEIKSFYALNEIIYENHLPTGGPSSSILAYLVNGRMFDEIQQVVKQYHGILTIYADDITISACNSPFKVYAHVVDILFHNGYRISKKKSGVRYIHDIIEINGLIHTRDGKTKIPNRIYKRISKLRNTKDPIEQAKLQGLLQYKKQLSKKLNESSME